MATVDEHYADTLPAILYDEQPVRPMPEVSTAWLGREAASPVVTFARGVGDRVGNTGPVIVGRMLTEALGSVVAYIFGR